MYYWRITKYNPAIRNEYGWYLKDEWIAVSDIGRTFEGVKLDEQTYLKTEAAYVNAILSIMSEINENELTINMFEDHTFEDDYVLNDSELRPFYDTLHDGMVLSKSEVALFIKLALREMIWGKLVSDKMFVHFGYDYYMYAGTDEPIDKSIQSIRESGLFVEEFESPHLEVWDD